MRRKKLKHVELNYVYDTTKKLQRTDLIHDNIGYDDSVKIDKIQKL